MAPRIWFTGSLGQCHSGEASAAPAVCSVSMATRVTNQRHRVDISITGLTVAFAVSALAVCGSIASSIVDSEREVILCENIDVNIVGGGLIFSKILFEIELTKWQILHRWYAYLF